MQKKKASCRHRAEHALFRGLLWLVRVSPRRLLDWQRRALVFFFKKAGRRHSRLVTRNLEAAFPAAGAPWRRELKERIYGHFGRVFIEILAAFARKETGAILARSRVTGLENLERALGAGRGVILFSAHFGNWEWVPLLLRDRLGRRLASVARPMDNPLLEELVRGFREAVGSRILSKQGSLPAILRLLAAGEIVFLLIDQNVVPREGVFVDFFGRPAATVTTAARLRLKKGIPLVPAFLHYEGEAIVLEVLPEVRPAGADVAALTQELTARIEERVRRFPEQWFWFHDRWKTRPQGEAHASP